MKLGLIGNPVAHSFSPWIHNRIAEFYGGKVEYRAYQLQMQQVFPFVTSFFAQGGDGLNVTIPYKADVLPLCVACSLSASRNNSVNTLYTRNKEILGESTDGAGFCEDIKRLGFSFKGLSVLLVGSGGAARILLANMLASGVSQIDVYGRSFAKIEAWVKNLHSPQVRACSFQDLGTYDLLVEASGASMRGEDPVFTVRHIRAGGLVYDLYYQYGNLTSVCRWAKDKEIQTADGYGMLLAQAILSHTIWAKKDLPYREIFTYLLGLTPYKRQEDFFVVPS